MLEAVCKRTSNYGIIKNGTLVKWKFNFTFHSNIVKVSDNSKKNWPHSYRLQNLFVAAEISREELINSGFVIF